MLPHQSYQQICRSSFKSDPKPDPDHPSIATALVPATTFLTLLEHCSGLLTGLPASMLIPYGLLFWCSQRVFATFKSDYAPSLFKAYLWLPISLRAKAKVLPMAPLSWPSPTSTILSSHHTSFFAFPWPHQPRSHLLPLCLEFFPKNTCLIFSLLSGLYLNVTLWKMPSPPY